MFTVEIYLQAHAIDLALLKIIRQSTCSYRRIFRRNAPDSTC